VIFIATLHVSKSWQCIICCQQCHPRTVRLRNSVYGTCVVPVCAGIPVVCASCWQTDSCIQRLQLLSPNSTRLVTLRLDTTRHLCRVEPVHFGCVELVEQHGSTRSSRHARHVERVVSCRDVTSRMEFGLNTVTVTRTLTNTTKQRAIVMCQSSSSSFCFISDMQSI